MQLDDRPIEGCKSIMKRPRRMGERARVHDDGRTPPARPMHRVDKITFMIRLHVVKLKPECRGCLTCSSDMIVKGRSAVHLWFPLAEQVQVRPVEKQHSGHKVSRYRAADIRYST